ncbi:RNA polymerase sigma factor [Nocardiopsis sediminis]|uniref:RNA polymerase sigma factor n=1 Tax=Nocardiopsis sediminis TaxID=1778267 RepID=A0ABV8FXZ2_9ACTN
MAPPVDGLDGARDAALNALLGSVLRRLPDVPAGGVRADRSRRSGISRVARTAPPPGHESPFTRLLVDVFAASRDAFIGYAVNRTGSRESAEDIAQTAFMRVFARCPDVKDPARLRSYLWTAVRNLTNDALGRIAVERERIEPAAGDQVERLCERAGLPFDDLVALRDALIAALDTLSPREREAVVLRGYGGYTYAQTAAIMGVAEGSAKSYAHHGLARVRRLLEPGR